MSFLSKRNPGLEAHFRDTAGQVNNETQRTTTIIIPSNDDY